MNQLKVWHLVGGIVAQLILVGIFLGVLSSKVDAHDIKIKENATDIKRIDTDGPSVWKTSVRFSDKEAEQVRRSLDALQSDMKQLRDTMVRIEAQLKQ